MQKDDDWSVTGAGLTIEHTLTIDGRHFVMCGKHFNLHDAIKAPEDTNRP